MAANKEVKLTFRGVDKTRQAFGRMKKNFKDVEKLSSRLTRGFGGIGMAIGAAFGGRAIKKIIDTGDSIGKLSQRLGATTEGLSELKYAAEITGVGFNSLSTGLQRMTRRVSEAASGTGAAKAALIELGLSAQHLKTLKPEQQFEMIADAMAGVNTQSDKVRLAMKLFDTEGVALLQTMEGGAEAINKLREEAKKLGLSLSNDDTNAMAEFNDELTKMQAVITGLLTSALLPMLPAITAFFEAIRDGNPIITFLITSLTALAGLKMAVWFASVAIAVKGFTLALMANPIGLVAVSISLAVSALVALYRWFCKATNSADEHNKILEETKKISNDIAGATNRQVEEIKAKNVEQLKSVKILKKQVPIMQKHNQQIKQTNDLLKEGTIAQKDNNKAREETQQQLIKSNETNNEAFKIIDKDSKTAIDKMIDNFKRGATSANTHTNSIKSSFKKLFSGIQSDLKKNLSNLFSNISGGGIGGGIGGLFGGSSGGGIGGLLKSAFGAFTGGSGGFGSSGGFGGLFKSVGSLFGGGFGDGIGGLLKSVGTAFGGFFAKGGTAKAGKAHIVGDGGEPELFIPNRMGSITPFSQLSGAGGNNISVNMHIQTPDISSFNHSRSQITADMARQISRANRNL